MEQRIPLGRLLLQKGYITFEQLQQALDLQLLLPSDSHVHVGEVLLSLGLITLVQLQEALDEQPLLERPVIGRILIECGLVEEWQISRALSLQFSTEDTPKRLGVILSELGYTTQSKIEDALLKYYGGTVVPAEAVLF